MPEHEHDHRIHVGNAPIVMMVGKLLPLRRACPCGDTIQVGSYLYDPEA